MSEAVNQQAQEWADTHSKRHMGENPVQSFIELALNKRKFDSKSTSLDSYWDLPFQKLGENVDTRYNELKSMVSPDWHKKFDELYANISSTEISERGTDEYSTMVSGAAYYLPKIFRGSPGAPPRGGGATRVTDYFSSMDPSAFGNPEPRPKKTTEDNIINTWIDKAKGIFDRK